MESDLSHEMKRFKIDNKVATYDTLEEDLNYMDKSYEFKDVEDLKDKLGEEVYNDVWHQLGEVVEVLSTIDNKTAKEYVNIHLTAEVDDLKELFLTDFKNVKNDDPFKLRVLEVLGRLGITIKEIPKT